MNRLTVAVLLAGLLWAVPAGAGSRLHVTMPGKLVDVALEDADNGAKTIWFLVEPFGLPATEDETLSDDEEERRKQLLPDCPAGDLSRADRKLFRLDRDRSDSLVEVRSDLPWNSSGIRFVDLRNNGTESLLLTVTQGDEDRSADDVGPGLYTWDGEPASAASMLVPLLEEPFLVWDRHDPGTVISPGFGELTLYRFDGESGRYQPAAVVPMPLDARVRQDRITLKAQAVLPLEVESGRVLYITPPETFGKTRLRTTIVHPEAAGDDQVVESWSRFPEPEDLMDADLLVLDGMPVLVVQTKTAEKLALFGEKRVRVFPLKGDRSRAGFRPLMAAESGMNLWQGGKPWILDVNRDDREDLVIGYWKGLKDSRVVLEAFLRNEDGSFAEKPRVTAFDVEDGNRSYVAYARDLNGDDLPDLLVSADARLRLYPGLTSRNGKRLVDDSAELILDMNEGEENREASVTITVGSDGASTVSDTTWASRPSFFDINGDGMDEIVFIQGGSEEHPGSFTALFLK